MSHFANFGRFMRLLSSNLFFWLAHLREVVEVEEDTISKSVVKAHVNVETAVRGGAHGIPIDASRFSRNGLSVASSATANLPEGSRNAGSKTVVSFTDSHFTEEKAALGGTG